MGTVASPGLSGNMSPCPIAIIQSDPKKNAKDIQSVIGPLSGYICCLDADILTRKIFLEIDKIVTSLLLVKSQSGTLF